MTAYTPSTERVRSAWSVGHGDEAPAQFDRWLNTVRTETLHVIIDHLERVGEHRGAAEVRAVLRTAADELGAGQ